MVAKKKPTAKKAVSKAKKTAAPKKVSKKPVTKPVSKRAYSSEDGPVYTQFKNKPVEAIRYLMKVQKGVAKDALYRKEIGYVDIAWGKNSPANRGYGLKHFIEKHGWEFLKSNITIEEAIVNTFKKGDFAMSKKGNMIFIDNNILVAISTQWRKKDRKVVISCYTIKKPK